MRTILTILTIALSLTGAPNRWLTAGGWANARQDTDSLIKDSGTVAWHLSGNEVCSSFTRLTSYGGDIDLNGDTLIVTGTTYYTDCIYGQGYFYGLGCINVTGNATVTMVNREWSGIYQTGGIDLCLRGNNTFNTPGYGFIASSVSCAYPGKTTTLSKGGIPEWSKLEVFPGRFVVNGGSIVNNSDINIRQTRNGLAWTGNIGVVSGTGRIRVMVLSGAYRILVPKIFTTNNVVPYLSTGGSGASITFSDSILCRTLDIYTEVSGNSIIFNNNNIVADTIRTDAYGGNISMYGSNVFTKVFINRLTSGTFEMDGMTMTCHGNWTNTGNPSTIVPGSSSITFDTGCTVAPGKAKFNSITLLNTVGTVVASDTVWTKFLSGDGARSGTWLTCGIASITPRWGSAGDTINGVGSYSAAPTVTVGGEAATVVSSTATLVRFLVPVGLSDESHSVTVSNSGMSDTLWYGFCCISCDTVRRNPWYVNQSPYDTKMLDFYGSSFGSSQGIGKILIGSTEILRASLWTDTHVTDTIPSSINPGKYRVRMISATGDTGVFPDSLRLFKLRKK